MESRDFPIQVIGRTGQASHPFDSIRERMNSAPNPKKLHYSALPIDSMAAVGLTRREFEVIQWVGEGKRDREIAAILDLRARTVQVHVSHIFEKLNVETRTAAAYHCHHSIAHPTDSGSANQGTHPGTVCDSPSKHVRTSREPDHD